MIGKIINWIKKIFTTEGVYYIGGSDKLPEPLSSEEEAYILSEYSKGNTNVRKVLIERNLRLVVYIAKKFENTGINIEDLISIGTIGLIKGVNTYNLDKNTKLATYCSRCIENEILMHLRKTSNIKSEISFDEPLNVDFEGNELMLSDVLGTAPDVSSKPSLDNSDREVLIKALNKLKKREQEIIAMRFGLLGHQEKTQKDVADLLGISQSYISRLEKRIITRLKNEIAKQI